ncbi:dermonecrotic toxin domain-containing protein [Pseudomonas sp. X10]
MAIDLEHYALSLMSLKDGHALMDKARRYLDAWPDLYGLAHKVAGEYLHQHTGKTLDPDKIWWHVFDSAVSAPTFTGWSHSGKPRESIRFTELLIRRFDGGFQAAPDTLPLYGGFYTQDGNAGLYDATNQLALDPQKVMDDLWALDFASEVRQRSERFWSQEGQDFALLAKARLLASIDMAVREGLLEDIDRQRLFAWLGLEQGQPVTLAILGTLHGVDNSAGLHLQHYLVGGAGHLVTFQHADGRVVLYTPTTSTPLQAFADRAVLTAWVAARLAADDALVWFNAVHRSDHRSTQAEREAHLQLLRSRSGTSSDPQWPFGEGRALEQDLFVELQAWAKADLHVSQDEMISNSDLRKQLWRGYLGAFIHVFGGFAPVAWPIGLAMLGAGTARLTLDIDAAVRAHSAGERKSAILSAVGDALVVAFSIIDVGLGVKAMTYRAPPHERLAKPDTWLAVEGVGEDVADLDANRILFEPAQTQGVLRGVSVTDDGATWIEMQDMSLRVRYNPTLPSWLVVRDEDPYGLLPNLPVRPDNEGRWQLLAPGEELGTLQSDFWDVYMQPNDEFCWQMSNDIEARQRALLEQANFPELGVDQAPQVDEHGYRYVEHDGKRHYTFRQQDELHNMLLMTYSSEMSQVNNLFRYGKSIAEGLPDEDLPAYLTLLFDSLEPLPRSNASRLWRGGNNHRATGGAHYRTGDLHAGDVLVSTDITSFTENPYVLQSFVSPRVMAGSSLEHTNVFDDTSVVYELVGGGHHSGVPIAPMSMHPIEAEVIFTPGKYFRVESVREVRGERYQFIKVRLREVQKPADEPIYDLRTGQLFDRQAYAERVQHESLVERFFPAADWS